MAVKPIARKPGRGGIIPRAMDPDRAKAADLLDRWTRSFADIPRASGKEVVQLRDSGCKVVLILNRT